MIDEKNYEIKNISWVYYIYNKKTEAFIKKPFMEEEWCFVELSKMENNN